MNHDLTDDFTKQIHKAGSILVAFKKDLSGDALAGALATAGYGTARQ